MTELDRRRLHTEKNTQSLRGLLTDADKLVNGKACVYATGSYGRLEANQASDLDLFIVSNVRTPEAKPTGKQAEPESLLSHLDEICIKADLIRATSAVGIAKFDGDGKYLQHYSVLDLVGSIGQQNDDYTNTMTGRLLLLLESKPLLGEDVYEVIVRRVIEAYWRDYHRHEGEFMPAYLTNDILRLWRTFCLNYEARTSREPDESKMKGKVKNYKLQHSRMLTCYSALLYLLTIFKMKGTVSPDDAFEMTRLTPVERLTWLIDNEAVPDAWTHARALREQYEMFLEKMNVGESALIDIFKDTGKHEAYRADSRKFGSLMYSVLSSIDEASSYYRLIVV